MYTIFGEFIPVGVVFAAMVLIAACLFLLPLRIVLLLTMMALLLPSLDTPLAGVARLLRWPFLLGLVVRGLFSKSTRGLAPRPVTGVHKLILILCGLIIASGVWSIGLTVTFAQGGVMVALLVAVFLIMWNLWQDPVELAGLAGSLYILALLLFSTETVYLVFGIKAPFGGARYSGVFSNPNGLGSAVAFLGPFVYWKHRISTKGSTRTITKILGVVMVTSLFLSGSRSGVLASLICMGAMLGFVHRVRLPVVFGLAGIPLLVLVLYGSQMDTLEDQAQHVLRTETLPDLGDRMPMWERGFKLFLVRPFLGYGYAMSKFADIGWADVNLSRAVFLLRGTNYHNAHLQLAIDLGVIGLLVFWLILLAVFFRGVKIVSQNRGSEVEVAGLAFFAAFLALGGDTFVHGWAFSPGSSMAIIFWLVCAAVVRASLTVGELAEIQDEAEEAAQLSLPEIPVSPLSRARN